LGRSHNLPVKDKIIKIVKIGFHCCVRLQKQAIALLDKGHEVHIVGNKLPSIAPQCTTASQFATASQLRETLRLHRDADIIHVHNEPSWPILVAKEVLPNIPAVLDIHDSMFLRSTEDRHKSAEERLTFDVADGLVFVGRKCQEIIASPKPSCVLPSYVNEQFYQFNSWRSVGGIVYEGRIDTPEQADFMHYCTYVELCNALKEAGLDFHIYSPKASNEKVKSCYKDICILHDGLPYERMLMYLGFHDWGLCGNLSEYREWNLAFPNKLFEYLAGGIPVIALNAEEVGKFVEENGFGISVKSVDEIKSRWDERQELQKNVFNHRLDYTMEKHIHVLEEFYKIIKGA